MFRRHEPFLPVCSSGVQHPLLALWAKQRLKRGFSRAAHMLDAKGMRVAARVRRPGYSMLYPNQFDIRAQVPSGAETELSKIVNG